MSKPGKNKIKPDEQDVPIEIPSGHNVFLFPDGSQYEGDWTEIEGVRVREGRGIFTAGPEQYEGEWKNDQMCGKGKYKFSSGAIYEGEFQKNLFEGEGEYRFADGSIYRGIWRSGKMHGQGTYTDSNKINWKGMFFNGMYDTGRSYISLRPGQDPL
eukprot:CAMPEP_0182426724 /NCGR_PEP_ID=MMETSP1167-20130531/13250_1 /TAXON_ID=2988 /ORGANISM="Mallomonas Sp, Strain CCMP3275" /LENGTH=155 /DNA_ID=CAMNT_0024608381 /DNA_START=214 /DNA_END=681 /DNA_ORIENTATION=+